MSNLNLVCLSFKECHLFPQMTSTLSGIIGSPISQMKIERDLEQFQNKERGQYDAARILDHFEQRAENGKSILITSVDLYIPIFTFVFGLAKLQGTAAIVSTRRLRNDYYGLPHNDELLKERLIKEIVHELGHLLNLRHCTNYQCVMASSNTADDLDIKGDRYCQSCLNDIPNLT